jgi:hypothetical protein
MVFTGRPLQMLSPAELKSLVNGTYPSAGLTRSDEYAAGGTRGNILLNGRPNGVAPGSVFNASREIDVSKPIVSDAMMTIAMRTANGLSDALPLSNVPGNKTGEPVSTINYGNYGATYNLEYKLTNPTNEWKRIQVVATAPQDKGETRRDAPDGGIINYTVRVDGAIVPVYVARRGEGMVVGEVLVPPRSEAGPGGKTLQVSFTNTGNTCPPMGLELRPLN